MPTPLTPTSSQEIVAISPPPKIDVYSMKKRSIEGSPKSKSSSKRLSRPDVLGSASKTISHMSNYAGTSKSSSTPSASLATVPGSGSGSDSIQTLEVESKSTTLPKPHTFRPSSELKGRIADHMRADKYLQQIGEVPTPGDPLRLLRRGRSGVSAGEHDEEVKGEVGQKVKGKRKIREEEVEVERKRLGESGSSRERITQRMMSTLGKGSNPITNSDLYTRTDHFVSSATGHQQSNAGGGSAGQGTYWEVRKAKMLEQAREQRTSILAGCVLYINGSTGPKVSNLQLQNIITSNGGRFVPMQNGSCTHIIANGGLSGTKTQKWIDGQGGRGLAKRMKVVNVDWVLDSVERGKRVSEAGYGMIEDPSQSSLLKAFGAKPKPKSATPTPTSTSLPDPAPSIDLTSPRSPRLILSP